MSSTVIIRDLEFNYPALASPKSPFGTEQWEIQVATTDPDKKKELEAVGCKVREKDGKYVTNIKRKTVSQKGDAMEPPKVVDGDKKPLTKAELAKIGNGSQGAVKVFTYEWNAGGRSGTSCMLTDVQITDLVVYEAENVEEEFWKRYRHQVKSSFNTTGGGR